MVKTTSTRHDLEFNDLSPDDFERLVHYILREKEYLHVEHYGGTDDKGRDIVAIKQVGKSREKWYFQCKRQKSISYSHLEKELEKIYEHSNEDPDFRPDRLIFATSCSVSDTTKDKTKKKAKSLGICEPFFLTRRELEIEVSNNPVALDVFFGIGHSHIPTKLKEQSRRELTRVGSKFIPGLYTNRRIAENYLSLLVSPQVTLEKVINEYWTAWKRRSNQQGDALDRFSSVMHQIQRILEDERSSYNIDNLVKIEKLLLDRIEEDREDSGNEEDQQWSNYLDNIEYRMQSIFVWIRTQVLVIVDDAGTGKTNLLCNWVHDSMHQDALYNTVLLTGNLSISNESGISEYMMRQLEKVGAKVSTLTVLLNALQYYVNEEGKPVIIVIDAINENRDIVSTNESLGQFLDDMSNHPEIKVVVSCRTDFFERFSFHDGRRNLKVVRGSLRRFTPEEIRQTIPLYRKYFKIDAKFSEAALDTLSNPFVLRMFCEAYGDTDSSRVNPLAYIEDILLHKVISEYEKRRFADIQKKDPISFRGQRPLQKCLLSISKSMLDNCDNRISIDDLPKECGDPDDRESIYIKLLDEEIFTEEAISETETYVYFSSDSYREYRQARYLQSLYEESTSEFTSYINRLLSENSSIMSEGLFRFLFIELRQKSKIDLWDIFDSATVNSGSIEGLVQLEVGEIQDKDVTFIKSMMELESERIIDLTFRRPNSPNWKLGLSFQNEILYEMTMTNRDLLFGSYVYRNRDFVFEQVIENLRSLMKEEDFEQNLSTIEALVKSSIWLLGSNVTGLRYASNHALLELGIQQPIWMLNLIQQYWTIDDYYIRERLLSLVYALSIVDSDIAISCAKKVYALFLDSGSNHYSTHFMIREYAKDIVLIAYEKNSQMFSKSHIERIRTINTPYNITERTYGKGRPDDEQTGWSNYPIKMDMKTYVFGHLAHFFNKHRCDATDVVIEIIHDLGYTEDAFEDIDGEIGQKYWSGQDYDEPPTRIERFGKKYAWQAYRILQGRWIDTLPFALEHSEDTLRYAHREFDPLFPITDLILFHLGIDMLGKQSLDQWLAQLPVSIDQIVLREDDWVVVGGHIIQSSGENRRVAIGIESLLVDSSNAQSRMNEIHDGYDLSLYETIHYTCYNHEIPLLWECKYDDLASRLTPDEMNELFVMSGQSEFRIGGRTHRYALRADFIQTMGLTQRPRTMSFIAADDNDVVRTQSWNFDDPEYTERGEWVLVRSDFLKEYLQRRKKDLIIILVADCWGRENSHFKSEISYYTHLIK